MNKFKATVLPVVVVVVVAVAGGTPSSCCYLLLPVVVVPSNRMCCFGFVFLSSANIRQKTKSYYKMSNIYIKKRKVNTHHDDGSTNRDVK